MQAAMSTNVPHSPKIGGQYHAKLVESGLTPRAADAGLRIEQVMASLRRTMGRQDITRMSIDSLNLSLDPGHVDILHILGAYGRGEIEEVTVGDIATRMGVDPSRASRLVSEMVDRGIVRRLASQADSRRIALELTEAGEAMGDQIRQYKWQVFAEAFLEWPEDELEQCANLFERYLETMNAAKARRQP